MKAINLILLTLLIIFGFILKIAAQDTEAPTANCVGYLEVELNADCYFSLSAEILNDGSVDNETSSENLRFEVAWISREGFFYNRASQIDVFCYHQLDCIALIVIDEAGNESVCETSVYLKPNANCDLTDCEVNYNQRLQGNLVDIFARPINNVSVSFGNENFGPFHDSFDFNISGTYNRQDQNQNYIAFHKNDQLEDAWDLRDMTIIRSWILDTTMNAMDRKNSFIADVNGDGRVSTFDMITIRRVFLELDSFPMRWQFLYKDFYPEYLDFRSHFCGSNVPFWLDIQSDFDIVGYVPGDLDGSANRFSDRGQSRLRVIDVEFDGNEEIKAEFKTEDPTRGIQGWIEFDPTIIKYTGSSFKDDELNLREAKDGKIGYLKLGSEEENITEFSFEFESLTRGKLSEVLTVADSKSTILSESNRINNIQTVFQEMSNDTIPPQVICIYGLAVGLTPSCDAFFHAEALNSGSNDNVTDEEDLRFEIGILDRHGNEIHRGETVYFDCLGNIPVILYAYDEAGNEEKCATIVQVQKGDCSEVDCSLDPRTVRFSGALGVGISGVHMEINEEPVGVFDRSYDFEYETNHYSRAFGVHLHASKNDDELSNGINTLDLIYLRRHLLRLANLNACGFLAADVNSDGRLTTLDMIILRQIILDIPVSGIQQWIFWDESLGCEGFVREGIFDYVSEDSDEFIGNFMAIKKGDVNGDADLTSRTKETISTEVLDKTFRSGEIVELEFPLDQQAYDFIGAQMSLDFDRDILEYAPRLSDQENQSLAKDGSINLSYDFILSEDSKLITLRFRAKKDGKLSDCVRIDQSSSLRSELYDNSLSIYHWEYRWTEKEEYLSFSPNPFHEKVNIEFFLNEAQNIEIVWRDLKGIVVCKKEAYYPEGQHSIHFNASDIGSKGLFLVEFKKKSENNFLKIMAF